MSCGRVDQTRDDAKTRTVNSPAVLSTPLTSSEFEKLQYRRCHDAEFKISLSTGQIRYARACLVKREEQNEAHETPH